MNPAVTVPMVNEMMNVYSIILMLLRRVRVKQKWFDNENSLMNSNNVL